MATDVWFRNPHSYIKELAEMGEGQIVWFRPVYVARRIDPLKHARVYFQRAVKWKIMLVGPQGTAEYDETCSDLDKPLAVYPTWDYDIDDSALLEEMLANPIGEDKAACSSTDAPGDETPVYGQPHKVVIMGCPSAASGSGKKFLRYINDLQKDFPEAIIHMHGLWGWKAAFGMGFRSVDIDPRSYAQASKLITPAGRAQNWEMFAKNPQWVTLLGFRLADMGVPRNRCMYNIASAKWAGEYFDRLYKFNTHPGKILDPDSLGFEPAKTKHVFSQQKTVLRKKVPMMVGGDAFLCDTCRLADGCKYFRTGAVCAVPGAEPTNLSKYFGSRDADLIIDGLGQLLVTQSRRLEQGLQDESMEEDLNPEVTKIINQLFANGTKLAKLINPALNGGPNVQVNVGQGGAAQVVASSPKQMIGAVVRELEARGVSRDNITPQMIEATLAAMAQGIDQHKAIEGQVVE